MLVGHVLAPHVDLLPTFLDSVHCMVFFCRARPSMSSTTVVVAPSVFAPPMFSPFGGFGYGYGGFMPVSIFGSLFQVHCNERVREGFITTDTDQF